MILIKVNDTEVITDEQMSDLLVAAFEGGINYWCGEVSITKNPKDVEYASEVIASGGTLDIHDDESDATEELNQEKMIKGIVLGMEWAEVDNVQVLMDGHDAETADVIVQYALFGEIVFG